MELKCLVISLLLLQVTYGFNLEPRVPLIKQGPKGSYFGYSIAQHISSTGGQNIQHSRLVVGAPKYNGTGGVYDCSITTLQSDCKLLNIEDEPYAEEDRTDQWLGVTVRSEGPGGQVLVCAHRPVTIASNARWGLGLCYTLLSSLDVDDHFTPCSGRSTQKAHEEFGYCQVGTSGAFTENKEIIFGSPGPYTWRGTVFNRNIEKSIFADKQWYNGPLDNDPPVDKYSYLGMSVTSGRFNGNNISFVAGAPRSEGNGQVVFFEKISAQPTLNVQFKLTGDTFASSFGYELATIDLNGDSKLDLVVGAPFYYGKEAGGAIYIYMNSEKGINEKTQPIVITGKPDSRFGFAITNLKDLNKDGFEDLAVGAPYENRGVIYIYLGSSEGIKKEPSQVIISENIPGPEIRTFGYSLSGGLDLDANGYPDLLVGAYESDRVILIRSRPVINIETKVDGELSNIDPSRPGCKRNPKASGVCFTFQTCFKLSSSNRSTSSSNIKVRYQLIAETFGTKKFSRVKFVEKADPDFNNRIDELITLRTGSSNFQCKEVTAYLKEGTIDILNPIAFKVTYNLEQEKPVPEREGTNVLNINSYPILNQQMASRIFQASFAKDCGENDICESDLITDVKLNLRNNELILGTMKEVTLNISVRNREDPAYEAAVYITHPRNLSFVAGKSERNMYPCSPLNKTIISCYLGNPFKSSSGTAEMMLRFSPASVDDNEEKLTFSVKSNSTSVDNDPEPDQVLTANVIRRLELELIGGVKQEQVFYGGVIKGESAIKYEDEVGTHVEHNYQVKNHGPWKTSKLDVIVHWPYEVENKKAHGKWLLYMMESPKVEGDGLCEIDPGRVNPLNLQENPHFKFPPRKEVNEPLSNENDATDPSANVVDDDDAFYGRRKKREVVIKPDAIEKDGQSYQVVTMDCRRKTAKCFQFKCSLWNLDVNRTAVIKIRARLWNSTFVEDYPTVNWVAIRSYATLDVLQTNIIEQNLLDNEAFAETKAYPLDIPGAVPQDVPLWIIIVAACAGLLLLIIIVLILWRLGFFRRKKHEAMLKGNLEKQPNDVNNVDH